MKNSCNFAAVDIGSNAARILIKSAEITEKGIHMKKLQFLRIPLRLGMDVFGLGKIGEQREDMLIRTMKIFRQLLILYHVEDYRICATSAFREAKNGKKVLKEVKKETKMEIEIISGTEEARIIRDNYSTEGNLLYMDVGGGSTELSLVCNGELVDSHSFNIGTIRLLNNTITAEDWDAMAEGVKKMTAGVENIKIIGSGGNINKLFRLSPKHDKTKDTVKVSALKTLYNKLAPLSVQERMEQYDLRESRADVIVPATQLFLKVSEIVGVQSIVVPNVGLADGIINELVTKAMSEV